MNNIILICVIGILALIILSIWKGGVMVKSAGTIAFICVFGYGLYSYIDMAVRYSYMVVSQQDSLDESRKFLTWIKDNSANSIKVRERAEIYIQLTDKGFRYVNWSEIGNLGE